jgi:hypothetical protein
MSKLFVAALVGMALIPKVSAQEQKTGELPNATVVLGCHFKGVVSHSFYGTKAQVLKEVQLLEHRIQGSASGRIWLMILESAESAEVVLFEKASQNIQKIAWSGVSAADLRTKLEAQMLASRGRFCAGEQLRSLVAGLAESVHRETVAAAPPVELISQTLASTSEVGYFRMTVFYPC